ncbi:Fic family protein [Candidatus Woesearchaeota archaeon]|nr:Fic family protein [Candidatus Woesearchaeota archaeon]
MFFTNKTINGKKYKYVVESVRLPNGKVKTLEKIYKNETKEELNTFFEEKEKLENIKYALEKFKIDHIITKEQLEKIERIRLDYRKLLRKLSKENIKDLLDRFTCNFTYESNALEGNSLTLKDVAIILFEKLSIEGKDLREIYETSNSRKVVDLLFKNSFNISHKDIIRMHKILMNDIDTRVSYKKIPNIILGSKVKTVAPEKVYSAMDDLIKWYDGNKENVHPIRLAALFHGKFEQIHPFEDGNGRVGRFLINIILLKNKYPPLVIRKSQRIAYLKTLSDLDNGYYDNLERFILERFKETYNKFFGVYVKYV